MQKGALILTLVLVVAFANYSPDLGTKLCRLTVASYCAPAKVK